MYIYASDHIHPCSDMIGGLRAAHRVTHVVGRGPPKKNECLGALRPARSTIKFVARHTCVYIYICIYIYILDHITQCSDMIRGVAGGPSCHARGQARPPQEKRMPRRTRPGRSRVYILLHILHSTYTISSLSPTLIIVGPLAGRTCIRAITQ